MNTGIIESIQYRVLLPSERTGREKYEVTKEFRCYTGILGRRIIHQYYELHEDGLAILKVGYRWDGKSGPGVDSAGSMTGTAIHDLGYQLDREGHLTGRRKEWDQLFKYLLEMFGVHSFWSNVDYYAVRVIGGIWNRKKYGHSIFREE